MRLVALVLVVVLAAATIGEAQRRGGGGQRGGGRGGFGIRPAEPEDFDGTWQFCRVAFRANPYGDGGGWSVDYPRADINMSIRLSELTRTKVSFDGSGQPNHLLVRATSDELFQCPFLIMAAPGSAVFNDEEAIRLREYVLKGGFLWADDFWGSFQWEQWVSQLRKVLPADRYPIIDIPLDHSLLRSQFEVMAIPQIPNIGYFMRSGGDTSEQGADSAEPHARFIADDSGRIMVFMTHNTDISDSWEREADDPTYFYTFGPRGYAFGINVLLHAMTH